MTRNRIKFLIDTMGAILSILVKIITIILKAEVGKVIEDQNITIEAIIILNLVEIIIMAVNITKMTYIPTTNRATLSMWQNSIRINQKTIKIKQSLIIQKIIILSTIMKIIRRLNC